MMLVISKLLSCHAAFLACAVYALMILAPAPARSDGITITAWDPGVLVDSPVGYDDDGWTTIENPCQRTLYAQAGSSSSSSTIGFAWAEQFGTFLIQSQQVAAGAGPGTFVDTTAAGNIRVSTSEPLPLHIAASWTYNLPVDYMRAYLLVTVYDAQSHVLLFGNSKLATTLPGEPASGSLAFNADVILPPGPTWTLRYSMDLDTYPGTAPYSAQGTGSVHFLITPEPSTLALLAIALLMCRPRRQMRLIAPPQRAPSP